MKESLSSIMIVFLIERGEEKYAYHTLEQDFIVFARQRYNVICNAQTVGRIHRFLINKQPIRFNGKSLVIKEYDEKKKKGKYWVASIEAVDIDLFGNPIITNK